MVKDYGGLINFHNIYGYNIWEILQLDIKITKELSA
jgi:hypothetical protein